MLIQNFSAVELEFNPTDKRVPLKFNQLEKQKIHAMYMLGGDFNDSMYSPYREVQFDDIQSTVADYYLNLFDLKGNQVIKDYSCKHLISYISSVNLFEYPINHIIDIEKSYISYSNFQFTLPRNFIYLLCVIFQNQNTIPFSDEINGSATFEFRPTVTYQDIKLSDVIGEKLNGKKIKKILTKSITESGSNPGELAYLDLKCFSGKHIENIPTSFLKLSGQQSIWFDQLDIDFKNSYFRQRGYVEEMDLTITELTFIY